MIYLETNNIGEEGAKAIAYELQENKSIIEIHLDNNNIGNEGAKAFSVFIYENKFVTLIGL